MIYFLFKPLFKLVASSFCKRVADLYEQRSRCVSSAVGANIETRGNTYHFINNNYYFLLLFQCLKYRTEHQQDIKKLEKLNSVLMRHAVAK